MEKKSYETPEMEIILADCSDVILASGDSNELENIPWDW